MDSSISKESFPDEEDDLGLQHNTNNSNAGLSDDITIVIENALKGMLDRTRLGAANYLKSESVDQEECDNIIFGENRDNVEEIPLGNEISVIESDLSVKKDFIDNNESCILDSSVKSESDLSVKKDFIDNNESCIIDTYGLDPDDVSNEEVLDRVETTLSPIVYVSNRPQTMILSKPDSLKCFYESIASNLADDDKNDSLEVVQKTSFLSSDNNSLTEGMPRLVNEKDVIIQPCEDDRPPPVIIPHYEEVKPLSENIIINEQVIGVVNHKRILKHDSLKTKAIPTVLNGLVDKPDYIIKEVTMRQGISAGNHYRITRKGTKHVIIKDKNDCRLPLTVQIQSLNKVPVNPKYSINNVDYEGKVCDFVADKSLNTQNEFIANGQPVLSESIRKTDYDDQEIMKINTCHSSVCNVIVDKIVVNERKKSLRRYSPINKSALPSMPILLSPTREETETPIINSNKEETSKKDDKKNMCRKPPSRSTATPLRLFQRLPINELSQSIPNHNKKPVHKYKKNDEHLLHDPITFDNKVSPVKQDKCNAKYSECNNPKRNQLFSSGSKTYNSAASPKKQDMYDSIKAKVLDEYEFRPELNTDAPIPPFSSTKNKINAETTKLVKKDQLNRKQNNNVIVKDILSSELISSSLETLKAETKEIDSSFKSFDNLLTDLDLSKAQTNTLGESDHSLDPFITEDILEVLPGADILDGGITDKEIIISSADVSIIKSDLLEEGQESTLEDGTLSTILNFFDKDLNSIKAAESQEIENIENPDKFSCKNDISFTIPELKFEEDKVALKRTEDLNSINDEKSAIAENNIIENVVELDSKNKNKEVDCLILVSDTDNHNKINPEAVGNYVPVITKPEVFPFTNVPEQKEYDDSKNNLFSEIEKIDQILDRELANTISDDITSDRCSGDLPIPILSSSISKENQDSHETKTGDTIELKLSKEIENSKSNEDCVSVISEVNEVKSCQNQPSCKEVDILKLEGSCSNEKKNIPSNASDANMSDKNQISNTSNHEGNSDNYLEDISDGEFEIDEESNTLPSNNFETGRNAHTNCKNSFYQMRNNFANYSQKHDNQKGVTKFSSGSNSKFSKGSSSCNSSFAHQNNNTYRRRGIAQSYISGPCRKRTRVSKKQKAINLQKSLEKDNIFNLSLKGKQGPRSETTKKYDSGKQLGSSFLIGNLIPEASNEFNAIPNGRVSPSKTGLIDIPGPRHKNFIFNTQIDICKRMQEDKASFSNIKNKDISLSQLEKSDLRNILPDIKKSNAVKNNRNETNLNFGGLSFTDEVEFTPKLNKECVNIKRKNNKRNELKEKKSVSEQETSDSLLNCSSKIETEIVHDNLDAQLEMELSSSTNNSIIHNSVLVKFNYRGENVCSSGVEKDVSDTGKTVIDNLPYYSEKENYLNHVALANATTKTGSVIDNDKNIRFNEKNSCIPSVSSAVAPQSSIHDSSSKNIQEKHTSSDYKHEILDLSVGLSSSCNKLITDKIHTSESEFNEKNIDSIKTNENVPHVMIDMKTKKLNKCVTINNDINKVNAISNSSKNTQNLPNCLSKSSVDKKSALKEQTSFSALITKSPLLLNSPCNSIVSKREDILPCLKTGIEHKNKEICSSTEQPIKPPDFINELVTINEKKISLTKSTKENNLEIIAKKLLGKRERNDDCSAKKKFQTSNIRLSPLDEAKKKNKEDKDSNTLYDVTDGVQKSIGSKNDDKIFLTTKSNLQVLNDLEIKKKSSAKRLVDSQNRNTMKNLSNSVTRTTYKSIAATDNVDPMVDFNNRNSININSKIENTGIENNLSTIGSENIKDSKQIVKDKGKCFNIDQLINSVDIAGTNNQKVCVSGDRNDTNVNEKASNPSCVKNIPTDDENGISITTEKTFTKSVGSVNDETNGRDTTETTNQTIDVTKTTDETVSVNIESSEQPHSSKSYENSSINITALTDNTLCTESICDDKGVNKTTEERISENNKNSEKTPSLKNVKQHVTDDENVSKTAEETNHIVGKTEIAGIRNNTCIESIAPTVINNNSIDDSKKVKSIEDSAGKNSMNVTEIPGTEVNRFSVNNRISEKSVSIESINPFVSDDSVNIPNKTNQTINVSVTPDSTLLIESVAVTVSHKDRVDESEKINVSDDKNVQNIIETNETTEKTFCLSNISPEKLPNIESVNLTVGDDKCGINITKNSFNESDEQQCVGSILTTFSYNKKNIMVTGITECLVQSLKNDSGTVTEDKNNFSDNADEALILANVNQPAFNDEDNKKITGKTFNENTEELSTESDSPTISDSKINNDVIVTTFSDNVAKEITTVNVNQTVIDEITVNITKTFNENTEESSVKSENHTLSDSKSDIHATGKTFTDNVDEALTSTNVNQTVSDDENNLNITEKTCDVIIEESGMESDSHTVSDSKSDDATGETVTDNTDEALTIENVNSTVSDDKNNMGIVEQTCDNNSEESGIESDCHTISDCKSDIDVARETFTDKTDGSHTAATVSDDENNINIIEKTCDKNTEESGIEKDSRIVSNCKIDIDATGKTFSDNTDEVLTVAVANQTVSDDDSTTNIMEKMSDKNTEDSSVEKDSCTVSNSKIDIDATGKTFSYNTDEALTVAVANQTVSNDDSNTNIIEKTCDKNTEESGIEKDSHTVSNSNIDIDATAKTFIDNTDEALTVAVANLTVSKDDSNTNIIEKTCDKNTEESSIEKDSCTVSNSKIDIYTTGKTFSDNTDKALTVAVANQSVSNDDSNTNIIQKTCDYNTEDTDIECDSHTVYYCKSDIDAAEKSFTVNSGKPLHIKSIYPAISEQKAPLHLESRTIPDNKNGINESDPGKEIKSGSGLTNESSSALRQEEILISHSNIPVKEQYKQIYETDELSNIDTQELEINNKDKIGIEEKKIDTTQKDNDFKENSLKKSLIFGEKQKKLSDSTLAASGKSEESMNFEEENSTEVTNSQISGSESVNGRDDSQTSLILPDSITETHSVCSSDHKNSNFPSPQVEDVAFSNSVISGGEEKVKNLVVNFSSEELSSPSIIFHNEIDSTSELNNLKPPNIINERQASSSKDHIETIDSDKVLNESSMVTSTSHDSKISVNSDNTNLEHVVDAATKVYTNEAKTDGGNSIDQTSVELFKNEDCGSDPHSDISGENVDQKLNSKVVPHLQCSSSAEVNFPFTSNCVSSENFDESVESTNFSLFACNDKLNSSEQFGPKIINTCENFVQEFTKYIDSNKHQITKVVGEEENTSVMASNVNSGPKSNDLSCVVLKLGSSLKTIEETTPVEQEKLPLPHCLPVINTKSLVSTPDLNLLNNIDGNHIKNSERNTQSGNKVDQSPIDDFCQSEVARSLGTSQLIVSNDTDSIIGNHVSPQSGTVGNLSVQPCLGSTQLKGSHLENIGKSIIDSQLNTLINKNASVTRTEESASEHSNYSANDILEEQIRNKKEKHAKTTNTEELSLILEHRYLTENNKSKLDKQGVNKEDRSVMRTSSCVETNSKNFKKMRNQDSSSCGAEKTHEIVESIGVHSVHPKASSELIKKYVFKEVKIVLEKIDLFNHSSNITTTGNTDISDQKRKRQVCGLSESVKRRNTSFDEEEPPRKIYRLQSSKSVDDALSMNKYKKVQRRINLRRKNTILKKGNTEVDTGENFCPNVILHRLNSFSIRECMHKNKVKKVFVPSNIYHYFVNDETCQPSEYSDLEIICTKSTERNNRFKRRRRKSPVSENDDESDRNNSSKKRVGRPRRLNKITKQDKNISSFDSHSNDPLLLNVKYRKTIKSQGLSDSFSVYERTVSSSIQTTTLSTGKRHYESEIVDEALPKKPNLDNKISKAVDDLAIKKPTFAQEFLVSTARRLMAGEEPVASCSNGYGILKVGGEMKEIVFDVVKKRLNQAARPPEDEEDSDEDFLGFESELPCGCSLESNTTSRSCTGDCFIGRVKVKLCNLNRTINLSSKYSSRRNKRFRDFRPSRQQSDKDEDHLEYTSIGLLEEASMNPKPFRDPGISCISLGVRRLKTEKDRSNSTQDSCSASNSELVSSISLEGTNNRRTRRSSRTSETRRFSLNDTDNHEEHSDSSS